MKPIDTKPPGMSYADWLRYPMQFEGQPVRKTANRDSHFHATARWRSADHIEKVERELAALKAALKQNGEA